MLCFSIKKEKNINQHKKVRYGLSSFSHFESLTLIVTLSDGLAAWPIIKRNVMPALAPSGLGLAKFSSAKPILHCAAEEEK
jgi:hypothetical protein